jgi:glycosyltransferase involved in cell wall biosynthesis
MRRGTEERLAKEAPVDLPRVVRVGFIAPGLGIGGAERWLLALCKNFSRAVHVVAIFTEDREGPLAREAGRLAPLLPYSAIPHTPCDVIVAWGCTNLAEIVPPNLRGRTVAVSHGSPDLKWSVETCERMQKGAGHLAAVSNSAIGSFPRSRQESVVVIPNGAEVERCVPRHYCADVQKIVELPAHVRVVLFLGRLAPEKRPWIMAEMLEHLPDYWHAIVCGPIARGWWAEAQHDPEFWGQRSRMHLLDPVDHPGDLLSIADVFVLPSLSEGFPLALIEAWLAGVPSVVCAWPIIGDLARLHGSLSRVVPVDAPPAVFARAVLTAWHCRENLTRRARTAAWHNYTAPAMAARWEEYLTKIAA